MATKDLITKKVLTPKGDYIPLSESGLQFTGIDSDDKIEFHNKMQALFNEDAEKDIERQKSIDKAVRTLNDIVKRNGLERAVHELNCRGFELLAIISAIMPTDISENDRKQLEKCFMTIQDLDSVSEKRSIEIEEDFEPLTNHFQD